MKGWKFTRDIKKHKRRRWHKQSITQRHTMNKWTVKQASKHTDRHVYMCAYSPQRPHSEKRWCFSNEKLWFWSEYMIFNSAFCGDRTQFSLAPFLTWLFNCCLLLVLCYCLFVFVLFLPFFFFSSFFLLVHSFTEFRQSPHCPSRQHRGEEACQQGSP